MKIILKIFKKFVMSVLLIYGYNKLSLPLNVVIPFNIFTVSFITLFDFPGLILFVVLSLI